MKIFKMNPRTKIAIDHFNQVGTKSPSLSHQISLCVSITNFDRAKCTFGLSPVVLLQRRQRNEYDYNFFKCGVGTHHHFFEDTASLNLCVVFLREIQRDLGQNSMPRIKVY